MNANDVEDPSTSDGPVDENKHRWPKLVVTKCNVTNALKNFYWKPRFTNRCTGSPHIRLEHEKKIKLALSRVFCVSWPPF